MPVRNRQNLLKKDHGTKKTQLKEKGRMPKSKGFFIPKCILMLRNITIIDKLILSYIQSYTRNGREFFVSNPGLQLFLSISKSKASDSIKRLISEDYIYVHSFDGRRRIIKSTKKLDALRNDVFYTEGSSRKEP